MQNDTHKNLNKSLFLGIIAIMGIFLFYSLMEFFTAFLGAVTLYVISKPLVDFLLKKGINKPLTACAVILLSFFIILLPIGTLSVMLYNKLIVVTKSPQVYMLPFQQSLLAIENELGIHVSANNVINEIPKYATKLISDIVNSGISFFTNMVMLYFFLYFMIQFTNRMEAAIVFYLPFNRSKTEMFGNELKSQTISNAIGIPAIAVVHGLLAYIAYLIVKVPEPGFWAVITGFASIIPMIGTGLVWIPLSIYLLINHLHWQAAFLLLWGIIVIGLSDNLIRFALAKKMANVHPIIPVLGVITGLKYFGVTGIIFGPLLISYFLILLKIYYQDYKK